MKQGILPLIPSGATNIDGFFNICTTEGIVTWFMGAYPIRRHPVSDHATQRAMMAFLHVVGGVAKPKIAAAIGVHENTVRAAVKVYRQKGDSGFYAPTAVRGTAVMTPDVLEKCRVLLAEGRTRSEVAAAVGVKQCNIDKAIQKGILPASVRPVTRHGSTRSQRAEADSACASDMGMACVRVQERSMAALGLLGGTQTRFEQCLDVQRGGVLCALPALAANGLFEHLNHLDVPRDGGFYYTLTHVFILLSFMGLLRVKTIEALRRESPGEFGQVLGLDRVPEVRCLRGRLGELSSNPQAVATWANALSKAWMQADPDIAGTLYIDGHVRVYHGEKTELPRRYVASHRLCLRGVTDYWVNDREGKPFFYIDRPVDDGLLGVLRSEIVPRLLRDVPGQPSRAQLDADKLLYVLRLVFDRAGCSHNFFSEMWKLRIACMTYLKKPGHDWPESEFRTVSVTLAHGQSVEMELAERGIWFGNTKEGIWCREFRRLRRGRHANHQTAIVCTDYKCSLEDGVPAMFARWGQENFFRYMLIEFGLDLLADHQTEVFPCPVPVVNPAWRALDSSCRTLRGKIATQNTRLGALTMEIKDMEPGRAEAWMDDKSKIVGEISTLESDLIAARNKRRETPKHIPFDELPSEHKFERLAPTRKLVLDTVRMIAYRAETALAALARPELSSPEEARSIIKALFNTSADLYPDPPRNELRIVVHPLAEARQNRMVEALLNHLNDVEFIYPGTQLRMVYQLLTPAAPPVPENLQPLFP